MASSRSGIARPRRCRFFSILLSRSIPPIFSCLHLARSFRKVASTSLYRLPAWTGTDPRRLGVGVRHGQKRLSHVMHLTWRFSSRIEDARTRVVVCGRWRHACRHCACRHACHFAIVRPPYSVAHGSGKNPPSCTFVVSEERECCV